MLVLRAETSVLFDRLTERGYSDAKRSENIECEIMQICLEEAMEVFDKNIIHELSSNSLEDLDNNIGRKVDSLFWILFIFMPRENLFVV